MIDLDQERKTVKSLEHRLEMERRALDKEKRLLAAAKDEQEASQKAQEILQRLAEAVQEKAHQRISEVVTSCLKAVFDDPYEFRIEFERKRGKTEAVLKFRRGEVEVDPLTASGGGVVDVAAFALRVACLILHRPKLRRLVVLDEPFKFVSSQYRDNVRQMIENLAEDMKVQIIMVSHIEALETGEVVQI